MGSYKPPFTKKLKRRQHEIELMQKISAERKAQAAKQADPHYDPDIEEAIRARTAEGQFVGDDPATPEVNEAWEGGTAPSAEAEDVELSMANLKKELATAAEGMGIEVDPKWSKQAILNAIEAAS
jgi:hypothetical protein